jgi:imidazolonepropionase-like amidohydrolase
MVAHAEELIYTKFPTHDTTQIGDLPARMAAARIWLIATLSTFHGIVAQWGRPAGADSALKTEEAALLNPDLVRYWTQANPYSGRPADGIPGITRAYMFQRPLVRRLHEAGVRIMTGTDTPVPVMVPGSSLHLEMAELQGAGLSRYDVLTAATRNPGDFIRELIDPNMQIGRVARGYRADLLLVRGHPLENLDVLRTPAGVFSHGRYYDAARLVTLRKNGR